jgi:hypothetical protein
MAHALEVGSCKGGVRRSDSASLWGQIKIHDDQHSEATRTMTKFCSDPKSVCSERARTRTFHIPNRSAYLKQYIIPGAEKSAEIPTLSTEARALNSICQGERWERVDCKLQQRRGAYRVPLQKHHVCFAEVCRRHVPLPVHANQGTKALPRVLIFPRPPMLIKAQMHRRGLFKSSRAYYIFNSCLCSISLGYRPI